MLPQIFTSVTNEARAESISRVHKFKQRKYISSSQVKSKYAIEEELKRDLLSEIKEIVSTVHNDEDELDQPDQIKHCSSNSSLASKRSLKSSVSTQVKKKNGLVILPSLESRYGNIVQTWNNGPCKIAMTRQLHLNSTELKDITDPLARRLRSQTNQLLARMREMSDQAKLHANCRKNVVLDSKKKGEDYIIDALERYMPSEDIVTGKVLLDEATNALKFRRRIIKRRLESRVVELWDKLGLPNSSKLAFKLVCERLDMSPDEHVSKLFGINNSIDLVSKLEIICDCAHSIDILHILMLLWQERDLPLNFYSGDLLSPIIEGLKNCGVKRAAKKSGEDMNMWMNRVVKDVWEISIPLLDLWKNFSRRMLDRHLIDYFDNLYLTLEEMVYCTDTPYEDNQSHINVEENENNENKSNDEDVVAEDIEVKQSIKSVSPQEKPLVRQLDPIKHSRSTKALSSIQHQEVVNIDLLRKYYLQKKI